MSAPKIQNHRIIINLDTANSIDLSKLTVGASYEVQAQGLPIALLHYHADLIKIVSAYPETITIRGPINTSEFIVIGEANLIFTDEITATKRFKLDAQKSEFKKNVVLPEIVDVNLQQLVLHDEAKFGWVTDKEQLDKHSKANKDNRKINIKQEVRVAKNAKIKLKNADLVSPSITAEGKVAVKQASHINGATFDNFGRVVITDNSTIHLSAPFYVDQNAELVTKAASVTASMIAIDGKFTDDSSVFKAITIKIDGEHDLNISTFEGEFISVAGTGKMLQPTLRANTRFSQEAGETTYIDPNITTNTFAINGVMNLQFSIPNDKTIEIAEQSYQIKADNKEHYAANKADAAIQAENVQLKGSLNFTGVGTFAGDKFDVAETAVLNANQYAYILTNNNLTWHGTVNIDNAKLKAQGISTLGPTTLSNHTEFEFSNGFNAFNLKATNTIFRGHHINLLGLFTFRHNCFPDIDKMYVKGAGEISGDFLRVGTWSSHTDSCIVFQDNAYAMFTNAESAGTEFINQAEMVVDKMAKPEGQTDILDGTFRVKQQLTSGKRSKIRTRTQEQHDDPASTNAQQPIIDGRSANALIKGELDCDNTKIVFANKSLHNKGVYTGCEIVTTGQAYYDGEQTVSKGKLIEENQVFKAKVVLDQVEHATLNDLTVLPGGKVTAHKKPINVQGHTKLYGNMQVDEGAVLMAKEGVEIGGRFIGDSNKVISADNIEQSLAIVTPADIKVNTLGSLELENLLTSSNNFYNHNKVDLKHAFILAKNDIEFFHRSTGFMDHAFLKGKRIAFSEGATIAGSAMQTDSHWLDANAHFKFYDHLMFNCEFGDFDHAKIFCDNLLSIIANHAVHFFNSDLEFQQFNLVAGLVVKSLSHFYGDNYNESSAASFDIASITSVYNQSINTGFSLNYGLSIPSIPKTIDTIFNPQHLITASKVILTNIFPHYAATINILFNSLPFAYNLTSNIYNIAKDPQATWERWQNAYQNRDKMRFVDLLPLLLQIKSILISGAMLGKGIVNASHELAKFNIDDFARDFNSVPLWSLGFNVAAAFAPTFSRDSIFDLNFGASFGALNSKTNLLSEDFGLSVNIMNTEMSLAKQNSGVEAAINSVTTGYALDNNGLMMTLLSNNIQEHVVTLEDDSLINGNDKNVYLGAKHVNWKGGVIQTHALTTNIKDITDIKAFTQAELPECQFLDIDSLTVMTNKKVVVDWEINPIRSWDIGIISEETIQFDPTIKQKTVRGLYFEARRGDIDIKNDFEAKTIGFKADSGKVHEAEGVNVTGKEAATAVGRDEVKIEGKFVGGGFASVMSLKDHVVISGTGTVAGNRAEISAYKDVLIECKETKKPAARGDKIDYDQGNAIAGSGGLLITSTHGEVDVDGNAVAKGDVYLAGRDGVYGEGHANAYCAKDKTERSGIFGQKKVHKTEYKVNAAPANIGSTDGKVYIKHAGHFTATNFFSKFGTYLDGIKKANGKQDIDFEPIILEGIPYSEEDSNWWGATGSKASGTNDFTLPCTSTGPMYFSVPKGNFHSAGYTFDNADNLNFDDVGNVVMDDVVENHTYEIEEWGPRVSLFGKTIVGSNVPKGQWQVPINLPDSLYTNYKNLSHDNNAETIASDLFNLGTEAINTANELSYIIKTGNVMKGLLSHLAHDFEPKVRLSYEHTHTKGSFQTTVGGGHVGKLKIHARGSVHFNGVPIKVDGDADIDCQELYVNGQRVYSKSKTDSHSFIWDVNMSGKLSGVGASASHSSMEKSEFKNGELTVGGTLTLNAKKVHEDGGNITAEHLKGRVGELDAEDEMSDERAEQTSFSVTSKDFSVERNTHRAETTTPSGIHSKDAIRKNEFNVKTIKGNASITSDDVNELAPESGHVAPVKGHETNTHIGISGNWKKLFDSGKNHANNQSATIRNKSNDEISHINRVVTGTISETTNEYEYGANIFGAKGTAVQNVNVTGLVVGPSKRLTKHKRQEVKGSLYTEVGETTTELSKRLHEIGEELGLVSREKPATPAVMTTTAQAHKPQVKQSIKKTITKKKTIHKKPSNQKQFNPQLDDSALRASLRLPTNIVYQNNTKPTNKTKPSNKTTNKTTKKSWFDKQIDNVRKKQDIFKHSLAYDNEQIAKLVPGGQQIAKKVDAAFEDAEQSIKETYTETKKTVGTYVGAAIAGVDNGIKNSMTELNPVNSVFKSFAETVKTVETITDFETYLIGKTLSYLYHTTHLDNDIQGTLFEEYAKKVANVYHQAEASIEQQLTSDFTHAFHDALPTEKLAVTTEMLTRFLFEGAAAFSPENVKHYTETLTSKTHIDYYEYAKQIYTQLEKDVVAPFIGTFQAGEDMIDLVVQVAHSVASFNMDAVLNHLAHDQTAEQYFQQHLFDNASLDPTHLKQHFKECWKVIKEQATIFLQDPTDEKLRKAARMLAPFLIPAAIGSGVGLVADLVVDNAIENAAAKLPLFQYIPEEEALNAIVRPIYDTVSLSDIAKLSEETDFLYIINENKELLITTQKFDKPISLGSYTTTWKVHEELAEFRNVYAAGMVSILEDGEILVDNFAPTYNPEGEYLENFVKSIFKRDYPNIDIKYEDYTVARDALRNEIDEAGGNYHNPKSMMAQLPPDMQEDLRNLIAQLKAQNMEQLMNNIDITDTSLVITEAQEQALKQLISANEDIFDVVEDEIAAPDIAMEPTNDKLIHSYTKILRHIGMFGESNSSVKYSKEFGYFFDENDLTAPGDSLGAMKAWSKSARVKQAGLPNEGKIRFVPERKFDPSRPIPRTPSGGYIDRFRNVWKKGPARIYNRAEPFEWDVQLSPQGQEMLKPWTNKKYINVSMKGRITH